LSPTSSPAAVAPLASAWIRSSFEEGLRIMGAADCLHDMQAERQMELAILARFTPERAEPTTAGELVAADAQDRERARRELARLQEGLVPHE